MPDPQILDQHFPRYRGFDPQVPVWDVTPEMEGCFHRFYDTSPLSPSGRWLGLTRFADPARMPNPGEAADIILVDLLEGDSRVLARSHGWDTQLGAQVQWGADDSELFFNDVDTASWRPFGVRLNPADGTRISLGGSIYMVSPDGRQALSPCLLRTGITQVGYGVLAPPEYVPINHGAATDDGIYLSDTVSGQTRLLLSLAQIVETLLEPDAYQEGDFYAFHLKWNLQGSRIMLVLRWKPRSGGPMRVNLVTLRPDGSELAVAIPDSEWSAKGGHHPNWCPDGEHVMMNLKLDCSTMRLVRAHADGSGLQTLSERIVGSGHPSMHPGGRFVVTDSYPHEPLAFGDGTTPIRWLDLQRDSSTSIIRIQTVPDYSGPRKERRVDPHPAWDRSWRWVVFNACPDGRRSVFLADVAGLLDT